QPVEAAERGARLLDGGGPLVGVAHVEVRVRGCVAEFVGQPLAPVVADVGQQDARAVGAQAARVRRADAAGRPGDQNDATLQCGHRWPLRWWRARCAARGACATATRAWRTWRR